MLLWSWWRIVSRHMMSIPGKSTVYTLPELIDLAEMHNPETRVAWETARERAAEVGIARSAFFPTLTAVALASTIRDAALIDEFFHRQTLGHFRADIACRVFDLRLWRPGRRGGCWKANRISADLQFNDAHPRRLFIPIGVDLKTCVSSSGFTGRRGDTSDTNFLRNSVHW
jgi:hypothetical protein